MKWLTAAEVAVKLRRSTRQFRERMANQPGFPPAFRPGGNGHPLWREDQIDEWADRQHKAQSVKQRRDGSHVGSVIHPE